MSRIVLDVLEFADELMERKPELKLEDALAVAVRIQQNEMFEKAFMINQHSPSALEAIAMELGASSVGGNLKDAIYNLKNDD